MKTSWSSKQWPRTSERSPRQSNQGAIEGLGAVDICDPRDFPAEGQMFRDTQHHRAELRGLEANASRVEEKLSGMDFLDNRSRSTAMPGATAMSTPHYNHFGLKDRPTKSVCSPTRGKSNRDTPPALEESENFSVSSGTGDIDTYESWEDQEGHHFSERNSAKSSFGKAAVFSRSRPVVMIEVSPGVRAPLRGSSETWIAIKDDFFMPTLCLSCDSTIFTIQDAGFVICPSCRVVYPIEDVLDKVAGGVGLGFTYEQLTQWQLDIARG